ncbi:MAG: wax ester/triacylglycerol synthase domain-containing protein [Mycobacterium sp.]
MATFNVPHGAAPDYVRRLADDLRSVHTFSPPFNDRLTYPSLRRFAPAFTELADDEIDLEYHFRFSALQRPAANASSAYWCLGCSRGHSIRIARCGKCMSSKASTTVASHGSSRSITA